MNYMNKKCIEVTKNLLVGNLCTNSPQVRRIPSFPKSIYILIPRLFQCKVLGLCVKPCLPVKPHPPALPVSTTGSALYWSSSTIQATGIGNCCWSCLRGHLFLLVLLLLLLGGRVLVFLLELPPEGFSCCCWFFVHRLNLNFELRLSLAIGGRGR